MSFLSKSILLDSQIAFCLGGINMLYVSALAIGIVVISGFIMVSQRKKKESAPTLYRAIHIIGTLIGASIVVVAAFMGDNRLWTNIVLATIIVILGAILGFGKPKKSSAKYIFYSHATIGIICYSIFLYYVATM
ncbi:hypothetical protein LJC00_03585 [Dysgonomonas sp. OttesenSCG-928-M03]|nr:hypothetical protein [Dysgonomonas sp. OttesenSCG-928-M03]